MISLLVGMHFRPPAKLVLASLRGGTSLRLVPEPSNDYDEYAIQVWVRPSVIPESQYEALRAELPSVGWDLDDLLAADGPDEIQLGYVAASGGKPLIKAGLHIGSQDFAEALAGQPGIGKLGFAPDGAATVELVAPPISTEEKR